MVFYWTFEYLVIYGIEHIISTLKGINVPFSWIWSIIQVFSFTFFSMEAFMYLACKVQLHTAEKSIIQKQSITQYCNTLKMVYLTKGKNLTYIWIASSPGLVALRKILGLGIAVGVMKSHPTKMNPVLHCTIGSILTSIECGPLIPGQIIEKPEHRSFFDGIDFVYSKQNCNLNCNVQHSFCWKQYISWCLVSIEWWFIGSKINKWKRSHL